MDCGFPWKSSSVREQKSNGTELCPRLSQIGFCRKVRFCMDKSKAALVRSWLLKAQHDLGSAKRLANEPSPYLDTAIYHCQQAAEKALKAFLVYRDVQFEKIHNLSVLLEYCADIDPGFRSLSDAASSLTPYATAFRYPDEFFEPEPNQRQFDEALRQAEQIADFVVQRLPKEMRP